MVTKAYEKRVGTDVRIYLSEWPRDAEKLYVLYRTDRYPTDFRDAKAKRSEINITTLREQGYIALPDWDSPICYIRFFSQKDAEIKLEGGYLSRNTSKLKVYYRIESRKIGWFKREWAILFWAEGEQFSLCDIDVYKASGFAPAYEDAGELVMRIPYTDVNGTYSVSLPKDKVSKGDGIRLFFREKKSYDTYMLQIEGSCML